ncbi:hypothetical protein HY622_04070 [Candidatus Uhrbacteria bacterium]|nr:hypothetical protein [Candidatus Uhrbacteria bacterium]
MEERTRYHGAEPGGDATKPPDTKRERKATTIVAHSFVLKSASPEAIASQIREGISLENLSFTQSYMALGKNADGADALEPVAAIETAIKPGMKKNELIEPIESALFDAGYVRGATYHFIGSARNAIGRNESFWYAHASPFDELEHLQERERRSYIPLSIEGMQNLLHYQVLPLIGYGPRLLHISNPNTPRESIEIPDASKRKLMDAMKRLEMRKKLDVIESLVTLYGPDLGLALQEQQTAFLNAIAIPKSAKEADRQLEHVERRYSEFIKTHQITPEQAEEALRLANLVEELRQMDAYGNIIESSFRFLELIPKLRTIPLRAFRVLERSDLLGPHISRILERVRQQGAGGSESMVEALEQSIEAGKTQVRELRALQERETGEEDLTAEDQARELLENHLGIPKEAYRYLSRYADTIISRVAKRIFADRIGDQVSLSFIESLNEIENCDALDLIETALGIGNLVEKYRREAEQDGRDADDLLTRLTFEARRKLLMMMIEAKSLPYFEKKSKQGDAPFQQIWNTINTGPRFSAQLVTVYDKNGEMVDIITNNTPQAQRDAYMKDTSGKYHFSTERSDRVREITLHDGRKMLARISKRPEKTFEDYMRKIFLGTAEPTDLFGHALIVESSDPSLLERKKQKLVSYKKGKEPGSLAEATKEVDDHALVFDFIDTMRAQVKEGWDMKIVDFSPTPQSTDYRFQGERAGSGGKVRMSKFVIRLTSPGGKVYDEEIQIFIPAYGKSGFFYHEEKQQDDARYHVERYLERLGLSASKKGKVASRSSLAELFLPPSIFSPTTTVYRRHKKSPT